MKFANFEQAGTQGLALEVDGTLRGILASDERNPGTLDDLIRLGPQSFTAAAAVLATADAVDLETIRWLPPFARPDKTICIGLNYVDHNLETGHQPVSYPGVFARFASSFIGHDAPIVLPPESVELDYEGELVAVIGKGGRRITRADALDHVAGYTICNDASIRDYQMKSPSKQWTIGKNFDGTGAFGPFFVTADSLPPGAAGLHLETRLNGEVMQSASTADLMVDVAALVEIISTAITLSPGDLIVTGTPGGVGMFRKPMLWMKHGDVCEVEIEGIGLLRNRIEAEQ